METIRKNSRLKQLIKKFGIAGFIILLVKGLLWVFVAYFLIK